MKKRAGFKFDKKGIKRKDFSSEKSYLEAIYMRNVTEINAKSNSKFTKDMFVNNVQAWKEINNTNVTGALNQFANTNRFTSQDERGKNAIFETIRKHGMSQNLLEMTRTSKGKFQRFDPNELQWNKADGVWIYRGMVSINIKNSPEAIVLKAVE